MTCIVTLWLQIRAPTHPPNTRGPSHQCAKTRQDAVAAGGSTAASSQAPRCRPQLPPFAGRQGAAALVPLADGGKQFKGFPGDIWALGVCLYMFIFGRPPFTGSTTYQIYEAIQHGEVAFSPDIPASEDLRDLIRSLLQKDPAQRISLEAIPTHLWVTRGGALPVLQTSNERAIQRVFEAMRKRNESGSERALPSTVPLAAPPEP
ncbi:Calcium/calmodulin-dependent protein kinase kinase 1, partial [Tetrabaena socialis]